MNKTETDVRIGERLYTFFDEKDITKARHIYAYFVGNQNEFETKMENEDIDFIYARTQGWQPSSLPMQKIFQILFSRNSQNAKTE